jgi:gas vesicle protein
VVGAAAALLLAPHSGAELRRVLRNRGKRVRNKATDAWEDLRLELLRTRRAIKRKARDARLKADPPKEVSTDL